MNFIQSFDTFRWFKGSIFKVDALWSKLTRIVQNPSMSKPVKNAKNLSIKSSKLTKKGTPRVWVMDWKSMKNKIAKVDGWGFQTKTLGLIDVIVSSKKGASYEDRIFKLKIFRGGPRNSLSHYRALILIGAAIITSPAWVNHETTFERYAPKQTQGRHDMHLKIPKTTWFITVPNWPILC